MANKKVTKKVSKPAVKKAAESESEAASPAGETPAEQSEPIIKALRLGRKEDGWALYEYTIQGDKILDVQSGETTMRYMAFDEYKLRTTRLWLKDPDDVN